MKDIDLAWLAGFVEGEGCFTLSKNDPRVGIASTDRDVVGRAANLMGAKSVRHYRRTQPGHKDVFCAWVGGDGAIALMRTLLPHMGERRRKRIAEVIAVGLTRPGKPRGSRHANSKLTEADVVKIRSLCDAGLHHTTIATRFGVCPGTIGTIARREGWLSVPESGGDDVAIQTR